MMAMCVPHILIVCSGLESEQERSSSSSSSSSSRGEHLQPIERAERRRRVLKALRQTCRAFNFAVETTRELIECHWLEAELSAAGAMRFAALGYMPCLQSQLQRVVCTLQYKANRAARRRNAWWFAQQHDAYRQLAHCIASSHSIRRNNEMAIQEVPCGEAQRQQWFASAVTLLEMTEMFEAQNILFPYMIESTKLRSEIEIRFANNKK
jgi:hypothetical protein